MNINRTDDDPYASGALLVGARRIDRAGNPQASLELGPEGFRIGCCKILNRQDRSCSVVALGGGGRWEPSSKDTPNTKSMQEHTGGSGCARAHLR